jgi:hypothetical protein
VARERAPFSLETLSHSLSLSLTDRVQDPEEPDPLARVVQLPDRDLVAARLGVVRLLQHELRVPRGRDAAPAPLLAVPDPGRRHEQAEVVLEGEDHRLVAPAQGPAEQVARLGLLLLELRLGLLLGLGRRGLRRLQLALLLLLFVPFLVVDVQGAGERRRSRRRLRGGGAGLSSSSSPPTARLQVLPRRRRQRRHILRRRPVPRLPRSVAGRRRKRRRVVEAGHDRGGPVLPRSFRGRGG